MSSQELFGDPNTYSQGIWKTRVSLSFFAENPRNRRPKDPNIKQRTWTKLPGLYGTTCGCEATWVRLDEGRRKDGKQKKHDQTKSLKALP